MIQGEVSPKSNYQRTSYGSIAFVDVDLDGRYITLENTSGKDVNMDGYTIKRHLGGKRQQEYIFRNFTLKRHKEVKIWAKEYSTNAGSNGLVNQDSEKWETGPYVTTTLFNENGEEMARIIEEIILN